MKWYKYIQAPFAIAYHMFSSFLRMLRRGIKIIIGR